MRTTSNTAGSATVAVLGGTGRTGRRVADRLRARGVEVRVGSRVGSRPFRWEASSTWESMLHGCAAAYVAYAPDVSHPDAAETLGAFAELAHRCRVSRLVLLSGRGEEGARRAEEAVRAAGVRTTVLRSSVFAQNFSEHFFRDAVTAGSISVPAGEVAEPFLDLEDLAEVAVHLLTAPVALEDTLELTGPRLVTFAEAAAELSAALGRPVVYRPVTVEEFVAEAVRAGVAPLEAGTLGAVFAQIFDGRNATTTHTVEQVLGRPPGTFADYVRRTAASGVWLPDPPSEGVLS